MATYVKVSKPRLVESYELVMPIQNLGWLDHLNYLSRHSQNSFTSKNSIRKVVEFITSFYSISIIFEVSWELAHPSMKKVSLKKNMRYGLWVCHGSLGDVQKSSKTKKNYSWHPPFNGTTGGGKMRERTSKALSTSMAEDK